MANFNYDQEETNERVEAYRAAAVLELVKVATIYYMQDNYHLNALK